MASIIKIGDGSIISGLRKLGYFSFLPPPSSLPLFSFFPLSYAPEGSGGIEKNNSGPRFLPLLPFFPPTGKGRDLMTILRLSCSGAFLLFFLPFSPSLDQLVISDGYYIGSIRDKGDR